ncbi:transporter substrate-binding domain-containing protein [uncultured Paraglaciecola sp.]|mgnify:CR=1 FL=1|uniref:substrate-binding periplasmic protein n=1 Tax=uncultured Paraglaciecola sp. TaxID=1765024 RepID=UPI0030DD748C
MFWYIVSTNITWRVHIKHISFCGLCFVLAIFTRTVDASPPIKFFVWSDDLAPILYLDQQTKVYGGIVIDIFSAGNLAVKYTRHNRNRGEEALYLGELDAAILSKEWVRHPDKLVYSLPIYVHKEFLYANHPIADKPLSELLPNKIICTRRGYVYPKIDAFFKSKVSLRIDSHIEATQFEMLRRHRCDFVVTNEFVGQWIIEKNAWGKDIYRSKTPIDEVDFTFAVHPKNQDFLDVLNLNINQLTQSGELQKIILQQRRSISTND